MERGHQQNMNVMDLQLLNIVHISKAKTQLALHQVVVRAPVPCPDQALLRPELASHLRKCGEGCEGRD